MRPVPQRNRPNLEVELLQPLHAQTITKPNRDNLHGGVEKFTGPATTQNVVVKFDDEICGGVLVEDVSDDFPSKRSSKISFQTSPEVRHQFRRKLRQLHSGNRWCLEIHRVHKRQKTRKSRVRQVTNDPPLS